MKTTRLYVQFIDDIDNLQYIDSTYCIALYEMKKKFNWILEIGKVLTPP